MPFLLAVGAPNSGGGSQLLRSRASVSAGSKLHSFVWVVSARSSRCFAGIRLAFFWYLSVPVFFFFGFVDCVCAALDGLCGT